MPRIRTCLILVICLFAPAIALPHGDIDKPLFVSATGIDNARCKDSDNPCRSLAYALRMAGKGGEIRITSGTFPVTSAEDLFMLVTGAVNVVGGYVDDGNFRASSGRKTILTGVPPEFRDLLASKGFHVVTDSKGQDIQKSAEAQKLLQLNAHLQAGIASAPCSGGSASGLSCDAVDLLSHVAFSDISGTPSAAADVWGFVDLNTHREYAIVGYRNGTAVIDVTDPGNPVETGYIYGQSTTWRDVKVYQHFDAAQDRWMAYAYVTADGASDGLFVIDLSGLPHYIQRTNFVSDFSSAHNVYASNTDYGTGISLTGDTPTLIVAGPNTGRGQFRIYSLANPASPQFVGNVSSAGYMHDASSMLVTDSRKDTQCVAGGSHCEVLFDFNENAIEIWDITNASSPSLLGATSYSNASYVHSGWWSEDKQFLFGHDELDEQRFGLSTTLRVFSIADLRNPVLIGNWTGSTAAIDHNGFVRGNRYYMSNYSQGLTVLDISSPATPVIAGYLDTYPFSQSSSFVGAWGAYPYFHSGTIAISDISSGLYLAQDQTRSVAQGSFSIAQKSYAVAEGTQTSITVNRLGGSVGAVSVDFELVGATASASDFSAIAGPLNWGSGDIASRSIIVTAANDGMAEIMEQIIVRLVAPQGGATLSDDNTAHLYVNDPSAIPKIEFLATDIDVAERGVARAIVTLVRKGSGLGAVSVNVDMTGGDATPVTDFAGSTSSVLSWSDGDANPKLLEFIMIDDGVVEATEFIELTISNPSGATIGNKNTVSIYIGNGSGINQAPNAVAGNDQSLVEDSSVTLDGSQSTDPNGDTISYQWTQTLGQPVTLTNPDAATATFSAPSVISDSMLQFRLTVTDPFGRSDSATVTVTVLDSSSVQAKNSGGGSMAMLLLLLLAVTVSRMALPGHSGKRVALDDRLVPLRPC